MPTALINDLTIAYDVIGDTGRPWALTPGGRFSKDTAGLRELAEGLAERGNRVVIWDRPNTGASDVCFGGPSESVVQADVLAGLLRHLELPPAVIAGGSGGARVSMLTAVRHPDVATSVAVWWVTGGVYGLLALGNHYCAGSINAAWFGGMEAVVALPEWAEVLERNPRNRERFLSLDPAEFVATMERWMAAYCPREDEVVPGLSAADAGAFDLPVLVLRSGASDLSHRRETSEATAAAFPKARLVEPPWDDPEWNERSAARNSGEAPGLFVRWPLLAPILLDWSAETLG